MGKRSSSSSSDAVKSLFSDDNPFRRKPSPEPSPAAEEPEPLPLKKLKSEKGPEKQIQIHNGSSSPKVRKRKRGEEVENGIDKVGKEGGKVGLLSVGGKRKADDLAAEAAPFKEEPEPFDDEKKLLRTVFVGNLPLKIKRKAVVKEFQQFGEVESVRIRSVPLVDTKVPRMGAIIQGKVNEAVDSVHAYVVFKEEQSANAALAHNMALFEGNHIRVDMACPPRKKLKGEGPLYDRKRTAFVGNLPFDVKDEELYSLFCGVSTAVEAIRVVRDANTSIGKGIAYVLFKTREDANTIVRRRDLKIRERFLRVSHAKSSDAVTKSSPNPRENKTFSKNNQASKTFSKNKFTSPTPRTKGASSLSYQGIRASKSGGPPKKTAIRTTPNRTHKRSNAGSAGDENAKKKRPAVAARKAKQLLKKRKLEASTPENTHKNKKLKKH
ncbi:Nucleolar protein 12 [Rhynchospora pubera]|uniref:Nucleolar protein 12 n=1 Tax=Rhynchospora pubera TaxID=906938 RepID=A0AAV8H223_9POAL|nr:Nucleolar protein 12 [Rhynchospora pubera]